MRFPRLVRIPPKLDGNVLWSLNVSSRIGRRWDHDHVRLPCLCRVRALCCAQRPWLYEGAQVACC